MPLTPAQLAAISKLEVLAAAKLAELEASRNYAGSFHDPELQMLRAVPNWVMHVKEAHDNKYAAGPTESCLENLRNVLRHFKFNLTE